MRPWIDVNVDLPRHNRPVQTYGLVAGGDPRQEVSSMWGRQQGWNNAHITKVTHWKELDADPVVPGEA